MKNLKSIYILYIFTYKIMHVANGLIKNIKPLKSRWSNCRNLINYSFYGCYTPNNSYYGFF